MATQSLGLERNRLASADQESEPRLKAPVSNHEQTFAIPIDTSVFEVQIDFKNKIETAFASAINASSQLEVQAAQQGPITNAENPISRVTRETVNSLSRDLWRYFDAVVNFFKVIGRIMWMLYKPLLKGSIWLLMHTWPHGPTIRWIGGKIKQLIDNWHKVPWPIRYAVGGSVILFGIISTVFPFIPGSILYLGPLGLVIATADASWFKWSQDKMIAGWNWLRGGKNKKIKENKVATA